MNRATRGPSQGEAGFTLIEALVAVIVLSFGLIAITNLMLVAASSNTVANKSTAAAAIATREMERLKAQPFQHGCLAEGGDLTADDTFVAETTDAGGNCVPAYATETNVPGVGLVHVRWRIEDLVLSRNGDQALPAGVKFITVRAEGLGALTGVRSRAEFTTVRTENPDPTWAAPAAP